MYKITEKYNLHIINKVEANKLLEKIDPDEKINNEDVSGVLKFISISNLKNLILRISEEDMIEILKLSNDISSLRCLKYIVKSYRLKRIGVFAYNCIKNKGYTKSKKFIFKFKDIINFPGLLKLFCHDNDLESVKFLLNKTSFTKEQIESAMELIPNNVQIIKLFSRYLKFDDKRKHIINQFSKIPLIFIIDNIIFDSYNTLLLKLLVIILFAIQIITFIKYFYISK